MNELWKKLKYFSMFILITVTKQSTNERYRMTTTTNYPTTELDLELGLGLGGLSRMTDADFEQEYSTPMTGTPRPGMDTEDEAELRVAAAKAIWTFSQAAKASAVKSKLRRSPHARTHYCMGASKQVALAFDALQQQIEKTPKIMSQSDFQLLKKAIGKFRIRLVVHDNKTFDELKQMQEQTNIKEQAAELTTRSEFMDKSGSDEAYINAKDKYLDLKVWGAELAKEIKRIEPKAKYSNMGGGLFRHEINKPADPPGVASQHAQIAHTTGAHLRLILKPETIRRTFISLSTLTNAIRQEVASFLTDDCRRKDRTDVIKQIKESLAAAAAAEKAKKLSQKPSN
jgi:hypothetical protein